TDDAKANMFTGAAAFPDFDYPGMDTEIGGDFQRNGVEVSTDFGVHTRVIEVRERVGSSEHVCIGVIWWRNSNSGVAIQAGTGWDELTDDDIFLEAQQRISFAFHRSLCQHASGLLEGRSR